MESKIVIITFAIFINTASVNSLWTCSTDQDCTSLSGSICNFGTCECKAGQQAVRGGSACVDISPYIESPCVEDHQCARLFTSYHCRLSNNDTGACFCQEGHHYFHARCWRSREFGDPCTRSEECMGVIRDPYALVCNSTCQCNEGYYERQRGECRKYSSAPGGGCVLDSDCQFPAGACNQATFTCFDNNSPETITKKLYNTDLSFKMADNIDEMAVKSKMAAQRTTCNSTISCPSPFECSSFGVCICPPGYYEIENGQMCYAELGSPSTPAQCVGLLAEVINGICSCRPNFYYDENMRDCVRVTRRRTESCVNDVNCHTFGAAARCGAPQAPWGVRQCECVPETSVWDENRQLCRYFAGVGESCSVDSDCLAGALEIRCVVNDDGLGFCACPEHLDEVDGLCLTTGLGLGAPCQDSRECTATANTVCTGVCSCAEGYQAVDGVCAPIIGGSCTVDTDCVIENTVCVHSTNGSTCQCDGGFIEYNDVCWPEVAGFNSSCAVSAQCAAALGEAAVCEERLCKCTENHHHRDGECWPVTGLFEACRSSSQCFLGDASDRVVCRNRLCQCEFKYPYSQELDTCLSSKGAKTGVSAILILTLVSILFR